VKVIAMRGIPGSGKSTKVRELVKKFMDENPSGTTYVCSADKFFVNSVSGKYEFDPKKIGTAHAWCRGNANAALSLGVDLVFIDNTNTQKWEWASYEQMAADFGYEFETCVVGELDENSLKLYANRNTHGVPLEAIRRMAKRFEK